MRKVLFTLILAAMATPATASPVVYNNGGPNQANGNEMTEWIQAENFSLTAATNLTAVRFWALNGGYAGSITWQIYTNASGQPGTVIASGSATPTVAATGNTPFGYAEDQLDFGIAATLAPGTYWLGLHNGPLTDTNYSYFYWETTGSINNPTGHEQIAPFGGSNWSDNGQEHAFELFGDPIPEPATLAVFGLLGVGGLGYVRRRLKAVPVV